VPTLNVVIDSGVNLSTRGRQVCGMFDCPPEEKQRFEWKAELPIEERDWSIGLIVGPSGCGKSTAAKALWPDQYALSPTWDDRSIIDNFRADRSIEEVSGALSSVGFSTIPAWLRSYHVLSNGERFRADIARRMLDQDGLIVVDEFTSVVDRQIAKVACHSVQKFVRKNKRQLVAVTCHNDVEDWLQPDWVFEPAIRKFRWRSLQRRPTVECRVARLPYEAWRLFAPYHYMSNDLHKAAQCFGLWADGTLAAFLAVLHRPHAKAKNIKGVSRVVTLPDWQGLGLAFTLMEIVGAAYRACGFRFRNYPAHPAFVRSHRRDRWRLCKSPGVYSSKPSSTGDCPQFGSRPCAVFEFVGKPMTDKQAALKLIRGEG
jgi:GNAT superfamily N-acetyltransferase